MKALIIEDEMLARASLARNIESCFPDIRIIGMTSSVEESVSFITLHPELDLIFMDVELSDGECFEIFKRVEVKAKVIMTTAYDDYAIKAFEAGSIDYLLKPIDNNALLRAVSRCREKPFGDIEALLNAVSVQKKSYKERLIVRFNDRIVPVRMEEIAYFYSEDKDNFVFTKEGVRYVVDASLDDIRKDLSPERFFKISRSCIIAMDSIVSITKLIGGRLQITARPEPPVELIVSRSRSEDFLEWIAR